MVRNPTWARDELILALDLYFLYGCRSLDQHHPEVIALSNLLNTLPIHPSEVRAYNFRNPAGVAMKIGNLMAYDPQQTTGLPAGGRGDAAVWAEYAHRPAELHAVAEAIRTGAATLPPDAEETEDEGFAEGRVLERLHKRRERNRAVVARKLAQVLKTNGRLACEACGFDFHTVYGPLGEGFAECHHKRPLSNVGESTTRLSDLAVLCANCHRMVHRSKPMLSVEQLRALLGDTGQGNRIDSRCPSDLG